MHRRDLFNAALSVGTASLVGSKPANATTQPTPPDSFIDTNVSLFQWPFRRLPLDDPNALVDKLRSLGITEAWAGSFEAILHRDVAAVNERLATECGRHAELLPIGAVNPELPAWKDDLRRCFDEFDMRGVRVHPNYHGYTLADPRFRELLELAAAAGRFVQIASTMEDTRTQHPMMQVPDVNLSLLAGAVRDIPGVAVQILNSRPRRPLLDTLANTPGVYFDTARVDGTDAVAHLFRGTPPGKVMFGTHAPFLIPEAALIRTGEAGLTAEELQALLQSNAAQLRGRRS